MEGTETKRFIYQFGGFVLNPAERTLTVEGISTHLPAKEFDTLLYLIENSGRALTKDEMLSAIWRDSFVEEVNLAKQISRLRKILNSSGAELIETIPKHGYRFKVTDLRRVELDPLLPTVVAKRTVSRLRVAYRDETSHTLSSAAPPITSSPFFSRIRSHIWLVLPVLIAISLGVAAFLFSGRSPALTDKDDILLADVTNSTGDQVFDGTLKQALAVNLGQSPFLNIVSEDRVRETLRRMERSPDERVTTQVGREICQRENIKALLTGSIASLGSNYVITLEVLNGLTGEALAREQIEAARKEQVISKLGEAATKLRGKLGESISSIQKFDTHLEQVTTSSLEALKAYTLGREFNVKGKDQEAIPFFKHAVQIDPNFALGYRALAISYFNVGPVELAKTHAAKAFELRDRVTERERLAVSSTYYHLVTEEADRAIEVMELWSKIYPRDATVRNYLALMFRAIGRFEKSVESANEGIRLNPNMVHLYTNLGQSYMSLGRFNEAKATFERGRSQGLDGVWWHFFEYLIALAEDDQVEMQRQIQWAKGKPIESSFLGLQGWTAMRAGRYREAGDKQKQEADMLDGRPPAARAIADLAAWGALTGNCPRAKADLAGSRAKVKDEEPIAAIALALCGDTSRARDILDDLSRSNPTSTGVNAIWVPLGRAAIEIDAGNAGEAIRILEKSRPYEMGWEAGYWHSYIRGLAYLKQGSAADAMSEFQKILDRPGLWPASVHIPLAHLGIARAAASAGDTSKSRNAYEEFFAFWKDADADIPILLTARKEYANLAAE